MNLLLRSLAAAGLLAAAHAFATDAFEGQVSFTITNSKGGPQALDYAIKGQALRMDINANGHQVTQIIDLAKHETLILIHQQHMYLVQPMPSIPGAAAAAAGGGPGGAAGGAEFVKSGKTEQILGYTCHQVVVQDKGRTTEIWLAEGLGMFMGLGGGNPMMGGRGASASQGGKWEQLLKGTGNFPLRVISSDASGKEVFRLEATKITPGALPDSEFAPPEDYRPLSIPGMGGMGPMH